MRLSILQTTLHWESPAANRTLLAEKLAPLAGRADLVVLPEMFTTGFTMNAAALAEPLEGPTLAWLREQAAMLGAALTGSFICVDGGQFFNRLVFLRPDGSFETYDKRHLFGLAGEAEHFSAGDKQVALEYMGWSIRPLVCYDLRFPVWSRNKKNDPCDLFIYVANWPTRRAHHWQTLLTARAIENQAFVAGVNIVGKDGSGLEYQGDSAVIDFGGQVLGRISGKEGVFTAELSLDNLREYRRQLPFLADADDFYLR